MRRLGVQKCSYDANTLHAVVRSNTPGATAVPVNPPSLWMTCATVWNQRFDLGVGEPVLYVVATGIALGRTVDGAHWTSDTVAGLIVGYAIGTLVAERQKARVADGAVPASFYLTWKLPL